MAKMEKRDLQTILSAERSGALSAIQAAKLSDERTRAMNFYLGDMDDDLPSEPDRSSAVSSDVSDTIDGLMPELMEIFASGDQVVEFAPVGPEDEDAAAQETDYVNHVFMEQNPGFLILYSFIKDALISKVGIVKVFWEDETETERETYTDLSDDSYAILTADKGIKIVEHSENTDPETNTTLHDITIETTNTYGCAHVVNVPPEDFGISRSARSINIRESDYCFHDVVKSQDEWIEDGFDEEEIKALSDSVLAPTIEGQARDTVDETVEGARRGGESEGSRRIRITEHYKCLDYDGGGEAAIYRIYTATHSGQVLSRDGKPAVTREDFMPFAAMTPDIMPHRFFGRSIADKVIEIQKIKTALTRNLLDNIYLANNQRLELPEAAAGTNTIDDLLNNRPGGIVRTKQGGMLMPIPNQPIGDFAFPMLEYLDQQREWRSGVTRQGQGIDAQALQNQTAEAASQVYSMAQARMRLIARIFAETGIRSLFNLLHGVIRKNGSEAQTIRLRGKWVEIDPRDWKARNDMTVNVGLGHGSKTQQAAGLMQILSLQQAAIANPQLGLVKPANLYHTAKKLLNAMGFKSAEPFFMDPEATNPDGSPVNPPPPPPTDPKVEAAQAKLQADQATAAAQLQLQAKQHEDDLALRTREMQLKYQLQREQMDAEIQLKREQMVLNAQMHTNAPPVRLGGELG